MFITPKVLVNNIYSDSEPESEEERDERDAPEDSVTTKSSKEPVMKILTFLTV